MDVSRELQSLMLLAGGFLLCIVAFSLYIFEAKRRNRKMRAEH